MKRILLFLNILILVGCSELTRTRDEITQNAQVYEEDAFNTIELAKTFDEKNNKIHQRSLAQIVFPLINFTSMFDARHSSHRPFIFVIIIDL